MKRYFEKFENIFDKQLYPGKYRYQIKKGLGKNLSTIRNERDVIYFDDKDIRFVYPSKILNHLFNYFFLI